jgi:hypothetical protein
MPNSTDESFVFDLEIAKINICVTFFGIIGNFLCIIILFQKKLLCRKFNFYLLLLSFSELFYCMIVIVNSSKFYFDTPRFIFDMSSITCLFTDYLVGAIDGYCVLLTLVLSVDRLYAIAKPMRSRHFLTSRYPKRVAFFCFILVLIINIPEIVLTQRAFYPPKQNASNITDQLMYCVNESQSIVRKKAYIIICGVLIPVIINILPALTIVLINAVLLKHVYNHSSNSNRFAIVGKTNNRNPTVTQKSHYVTIIIIGLWLLITSVPYYTLKCIFWLIRLKVYDSADHWPNYERVQGLFSVLFNSNHSINIIIYILFHKCFRRAALDLIKLNNFKINRLGDDDSLAIRQNSSFKWDRFKWRNSTYRSTKSLKLNDHGNTTGIVDPLHVKQQLSNSTQLEEIKKDAK